MNSAPQKNPLLAWPMLNKQTIHGQMTAHGISTHGFLVTQADRDANPALKAHNAVTALRITSASNVNPTSALSFLDRAHGNAPVGGEFTFFFDASEQLVHIQVLSLGLPIKSDATAV